MEGQSGQSPKKPVWIKCRASESCPGTQAEIVFTQVLNPNTPDGGFTPEQGGRYVRYKCLTCGQPFHVRS